MATGLDSNGKTWYFVIDIPPRPVGRRRQMRQRGFLNEVSARAAEAAAVQRYSALDLGADGTVAGELARWVDERELERAGWAQSKMSRLELGKQTATEADIATWVDLVSAPPTLADELLTLLRSIEAEYVTWKRDLRIGVRAKQRAFLGLEARVTSIRGFETWVVPGLLQTAEYARHRIAEMPALHKVPEDVDQAVAVRMQRQQALYDPGKRFHFILSEAVLHSRLCPDQVFAGQLDRLAALSSLENVRLGILPFSGRLPLAPLNGFWIFDGGLVTFETIGAELHIRDPEEIALYVRAFEQLTAASVDGSVALRLLGTKLASLRL